MTADQRFTLIMTAIGLGFTILSAVLTMVWRSMIGYLKNQISMQEHIKGAVEDGNETARNLDRHIQWHLSKGR